MRVRPLIGRDEELEQLVEAIQAASGGRGSSWFLCGEPGIGKSRLAEELSDRASEAGMLVVWGRCWEAGGAPAYWPWIQVLRALLRGADPAGLEQVLGMRAGYLGQLLPELNARLSEQPPPLDAERGRFELLDAVSSAVCEVSRARAVLVILEDLHAADAASLGVFEVLSPELRSSRVCVLGTFRDGDARLSQARDALMAAVHQGRVLELSRLDRSNVKRFLSACTRQFPIADELGDAVGEAVFRATEGNPLFLNEMTRLLTDSSQWRQVAAAGMAMPGNVRHVLRRRLDQLSAPTQSALEVASVLGRDFSGTLLSALWERNMGETALPLNEALDAGVLVESAPGEYRFSHVLLREVLHRDLEDARRAELHLRAASLLERRQAGRVIWSEIAHHHLEAGVDGRDPAVEACRRAARDAQEKFGFLDARQWFARALTALGQDPDVDLARRAELLLDLADAELHSGAIALGKQTCERAAEIARSLDDAELMARAALTYGSVLVFASVDPLLVRLLKDALARLEPSDSRLRAVLTARLGAALQPAADPEPPMVMAREALAMASRTGDSKVWLETARYAVSALMDLAEPGERLALNAEYVRVAEALAQPLEVLRGQMRLVFDYFELGEIASAELSIRSVELLSQKLAHPFYVWRAHSFRAMLAIFQGRFADAESEMQRARELGLAARDPNVVRVDVMQRFASLRLQGRHEELLELRAELAPGFEGMELSDVTTRLHESEAWVLAERAAQAESLLRPADIELVLGVNDASLTAPLLRLFEASGKVEHVPRTRARLEQRQARFASGGMTMMLWEEPMDLLLARCHRLEGQLERARAAYLAAIELSDVSGARPYAATARLELAELTLRSGVPQDRERARELLQRAGQTAEELGLRGVRERVRRLESALAELPAAEGAQPEARGAAVVSRAETLPRLSRRGESWVLAWADRELQLKDSRGVRWLGELLVHPGRELHVLDLVAPDERDPSDAGEVLDQRAISTYRQRLSELGAELGDAEACHDLGRREKLEEEREFLLRELSRAVGIGGRERRAGAAQERARINVQRRLRDVIGRIAAQDPELGRHFERSIRTGVFCCYEP